MAKSTENFDRRANHLLRSIRLCGGCVPLHRLQFQFSDSVIQTLGEKAEMTQRGDAYYRPKNKID